MDETTETRTAHMAEPWVIFNNGEIHETIHDNEGNLIANFDRDDQRFHRIVACVNGCKGINPEAVPDLIAACEALMTAGTLHADVPQLKRAYNLARAAIQKAKGWMDLHSEL